MTARQANRDGAKAEWRIFVATDDCLVRRGFGSLLANEQGLVMCGEADPVLSQLDVVVSAKPDLVVVDLSFRTDEGEEFIKRLRLLLPAAKVMVISMCDEFSCTQIALGAGAHGYLAKDETAAGSVSHIRRLLGCSQTGPGVETGSGGVGKVSPDTGNRLRD